MNIYPRIFGMPFPIPIFLASFPFWIWEKRGKQSDALHKHCAEPIQHFGISWKTKKPGRYWATKITMGMFRNTTADDIRIVRAVKKIPKQSLTPATMDWMTIKQGWILYVDKPQKFFNRTLETGETRFHLYQSDVKPITRDLPWKRLPTAGDRAGTKHLCSSEHLVHLKNQETGKWIITDLSQPGHIFQVFPSGRCYRALYANFYF